MANIRSHRELNVWQESMDAQWRSISLRSRFRQMKIFSRRSDPPILRSVAANIDEAWRKESTRLLQSKLNDSEAEASETQTWIEIALRCGYLDKETAAQLDAKYEISWQCSYL